MEKQKNVGVAPANGVVRGSDCIGLRLEAYMPALVFAGRVSPRAHGKIFAEGADHALAMTSLTSTLAGVLLAHEGDVATRRIAFECPARIVSNRIGLIAIDRADGHVAADLQIIARRAGDRFDVGILLADETPASDMLVSIHAAVLAERASAAASFEQERRAAAERARRWSDANEGLRVALAELDVEELEDLLARARAMPGKRTTQAANAAEKGGK